ARAAERVPVRAAARRASARLRAALERARRAVAAAPVARGDDGRAVDRAEVAIRPGDRGSAFAPDRQHHAPVERAGRAVAAEVLELVELDERALGMERDELAVDRSEERRVGKEGRTRWL